MKPIYTRKHAIFEMTTPFGGSSNMYAIRDIWIYKARDYNKLIKVKSPSGTMTCTPNKLIRMSKMIEMYSKNPLVPMHLFQFALVPDKEEPQEELITIPNEARERLRELAIEKGWYKRNTV